MSEQGSDPTATGEDDAIGRFDAFQRKHTVLGFPLGVAYKFLDDFGGYLAALITYYGFLSLFPLFLLFSTILGLVLEGYPQWQQRILDSAISEFPIVGEELRKTGTLSGSPIGLVVGSVAAIYGGLGVGQALQYAMNTAWMVPRNSRPNPFLSRARGVLMICTAGVAVVATSVLTQVANRLVVDGWESIAVDLGSIILNTGVFVLLFIVATSKTLTPRQVLPGAVIASVLFYLLQGVGVTYIGTVVARASDLNSVFAIVFGLLVFIYSNAVVVLLCVQLNVVLVERLWPRSLLTVFTDGVVLTDADRRAYEGQVKAQRLKGFQEISVGFERRHPDES
ncbi:YihY/virulence factor BrkB family protein [Janibacter sp. YIM B02568]|uniref:YihY/virulence factor BrkB family protein n=1 Tax=Janibacter endophyticus TaxID=2806261 RepID=UPI00194F3908|nr:YihY/virulence factor BrkB family protein [Janibacter endophyticus]MBM6544996.1 YihY/virulence factor BrkB family protein [Janibacter endophyticus]